MTVVMLELTIAVLLGLFSPHTAELADGALRTAPSYLTVKSAHDHALAAVIAGSLYDVDPALLLSIGWHESRYEPTAVTREVSGKVSCGSMTPEPVAHCPAPSLLGGYLAGAKHFRGWLDAEHGNMRVAILGYGGGGRLIRACAEGKDLRGCHLPDVFLGRAEWITQCGLHARS